MSRRINLAVAIGALLTGVALAQDADPLPVNSQWKGKLTQRGKIMGDKKLPPEFETVLLVRQRKDMEFEGELREKLADGAFVTYLCKGKITPAEKGTHKVEFASVGVVTASEKFDSIQRVPYSGTIDGKKLKGTWKLPLNKEDTELEGEFDLDRQ